MRRPWCLSCCEGLDRDCRVIPFDSSVRTREGVALADAPGAGRLPPFPARITVTGSREPPTGCRPSG